MNKILGNTSPSQEERGRIVKVWHSPQAHSLKRHEHSSPRFNGQCVTSSFVLQGIVHLPIPRLNKRSLSWPAGHCRSVASCTAGHGGWAMALCTAEFSRAISPQAKGERSAVSLLVKLL